MGFFGYSKKLGKKKGTEINSWRALSIAIDNYQPMSIEFNLIQVKQFYTCSIHRISLGISQDLYFMVS